MIVVRVHDPAERELADVGEARGDFGLLARLVERGQEHRDQQGDDPDHHEQLDQCEPSVALHGVTPHGQSPVRSHGAAHVASQRRVLHLAFCAAAPAPDHPSWTAATLTFALAVVW